MTIKYSNDGGRAIPSPTTKLSLYDWREKLATFAALFKLRIVLLLLLAAISSAFLGAAGHPSSGSLALIVVTGTLAAGGASAINQFVERESDSRMKRTRKRPLVSGMITDSHSILWLAIGMIATAVLLALPYSKAMAVYLALGAIIYSGVYTLWLKPRTILNIVIGGASGSFAVMAGGAAVGAPLQPIVIALALLVFVWTPAHFWSLALYYRDDYSAAQIPMLPVSISSASSALWILVHVLTTVFVTLLLAVDSHLQWLYLLPAALMTILLLRSAIRLVAKPDRKRAIAMFMQSNIFLAAILVLIIGVTWLH